MGLLPFAGPDGTPSADVSEFAQYLDHIEIMNYDVWGSWSATAGPNAPLNDTCVADPSQSVGSAVSAVKAWTSAGLPAHQIVLAVGSYGHSFAVNKTSAYVSASNSTLTSFPKFDAAAQPNGDKWQDEAGTDICGNVEPAGGNFDFWGLVDGGFLTQKGTAAPGIEYLYDTCSQTVSLFLQLEECIGSFMVLFFIAFGVQCHFRCICCVRRCPLVWSVLFTGGVSH